MGDAREAVFERGIRTYGDPENPPILFLHGVRLSGEIWEPHARELSDEFYVVTPDLPGHGALVDLPFESSVYDDYLAHIARTFIRRPPLVVGYSLGGYVAMRYATDIPEQTAGLLLSGCSTDVLGLRALLFAAAAGAAARIPKRALEVILAVLFRMTLPRAVADRVIPLRFNPSVFDTSRKSVAYVAYSERLRGYAKPVMIVNGQFDLLFRPHERRYAQITRAPIAIMRGSDHAAPLRRPHEFAALVRKFARAVFTAGAANEPGPAA